ncbi:DUF916 and DUF3324 domain-containing protein [Lactobacillus sp. DCY120]|uniref:DUF916 and DUF3324 domain-containing protein n=1 Tax=Bombilactobacillus apium TaxID=2675299 RepID=A0A850R760_9LACO|nr:DUF916 and DUF3324 domain-containing protein [Bombilactobacillus apium]NVY96482.1 DUF916 and DUF3324 domain-containing protein [Bombilactobacillus apium]
MKKVFLSLLLVLACGVTAIFHPTQVKADSGLTYTVDAVLPDNQRDRNLSYPDLNVKPGKDQELQFKITNSSSRKKTFVVEANDASTSDGIAMIYSRHNSHLLGSPQFTQMVDSKSRRQIIRVAPQSVQQISITLHYPQDTFSGVVVGGLYVYDKSVDKLKKSKGFSLNNRFTYSVGIQLRSQEQKVLPQLNLGNVKLTTMNHHSIIAAKLFNNTPAVIGGLKTRFTLKTIKGKTVTKYRADNGQVAPISKFTVGIPLVDKQLSPGRYVLTGKGQSGTQIWRWRKVFYIDRKTLDKVNRDSVDVDHNNPIWLWILLLILVLLTILVIILVKKLKEKKDEDDEI